ncbi:MAG: cupin domain-containing protein [Chitinophagaceae bacterium]|nr:cupin domain-containing protein [Polaromonas sp.]
MKVSITQALKRLPGPPTTAYPQGAPFTTLMAGAGRDAGMRVEVFAPLGADLQTPHAQDELYFVHSGTAVLVINGQHFDAAAGDAFFVASGVAHQFEKISDNFVTWVVFYGPQK